VASVVVSIRSGTVVRQGNPGRSRVPCTCIWREIARSGCPSRIRTSIT